MKNEYKYYNQHEHFAEIAQGCIRCGNADSNDLVLQHVMGKPLMNLIPREMNGAKRCLVMCETCHRKYQAQVYALEHSRDWGRTPPEEILVIFAELIISFAGPDHNIPKRWLDWYDHFRLDMQTNASKK